MLGLSTCSFIPSILCLVYACAVRCRNQLDCMWVVDEAGETICTGREQSYDSDGEIITSCQCLDEGLTDNVTGRCMLSYLYVQQTDQLLFTGL